MNTLVTIPFSHYCEKARWALERARVPFVERAYLPLQHMVPKWRAGARTLPALLRPGTTPLCDSSDIVRFADAQAAPERRLFTDGEAGTRAAALEDDFDERLGPAARLWAYYWGFQHPPGLRALIAPSLSPLQRTVLPWLLPMARPLISRRYGVASQRMTRAMRTVEDTFASVGERLAGRRFLVGDRFSAADLTLAALGAVVVLPPEHPSLDAAAIDLAPPPMREFAERMRATAAGQHILTVYREYRRS